MSVYSTNPAGLNVGKRYGPRGVDGVAGVLRNLGSTYEAVIHVRAGEMSAPLEVVVPPFCKLVSITPVIKTAFTTTSKKLGFKIDIGSTAGTASTAGGPDLAGSVGVGSAIAAASLTNMSPIATTTNAGKLVVTDGSDYSTDAVGDVELIVTFTRI